MLKKLTTIAHHGKGRSTTSKGCGFASVHIFFILPNVGSMGGCKTIHSFTLIFSSIYSFISYFLSFFLPIDMYVFLSVCRTGDRSVGRCVCLSVCLSDGRSVGRSVCLSFCQKHISLSFFFKRKLASRQGNC